MKMKSTNLILLRHGQTHWNVQKIWQGTSESELTQKGQEQALEAKKKLENTTLDFVYVSPLIRTVQTMEIVLKDSSTKFKKVDGLKEIHLGIWEGQKHELIKKSYEEQSNNFWFQQDKFLIQDAETFLQLQERVVTVLDKIFEEHEGETVLVVSHCMSIKVALAHYSNITMCELNKIENPKNAQLIYLRKEKDSVFIA